MLSATKRPCFTLIQAHAPKDEVRLATLAGTDATKRADEMWDVAPVVFVAPENV